MVIFGLIVSDNKYKYYRHENYATELSSATIIIWIIVSGLFSANHGTQQISISNYGNIRTYCQQQ